jgi:RHS repeat-associated protein
MTDATGSSSYIWDPFSELTSATNGAGNTVGYGYDAHGNTTGVTYPLPASATWATTNTVAYGYNHADVLTSATDFNAHQITITPNADSIPSSETLGSTGDTLSYTYDPTDTPSQIALSNTSTTLQSFTYADAPSGAILPETDTPTSSNSPAAYTYDAQNRVTSMTPGTNSALNYGFDASGSLTTTPAGAIGTYDKAGELTSSALSGTTTSYTYSTDGERLTTKQGSTTTTAGTWNGARQLTAYNNSTANMTTATYDGNGLRASATTAPAGGSAATQAFVWDTPANRLLMDSTSAYIYGTGTAPAEQVNLSSGTITYLITDSLGSVRGTVNSSGTLTGSVTYDAWGNPETTSGLTATTPFGYAGYYTDTTGLTYNINRYYDATTGQFTSVDPDLASTLQPYAYAGDNPVSDTDPDGLFKGVTYKPVCGPSGCVNIVKRCQDNLKNCGLYWNTEATGIYKKATDASLEYRLDVVGRTVYGPRWYGHTKNANEKPFFHGSWGFSNGNSWGKYEYGCWLVATCTGYMKSTDGVTFDGDGYWHRDGLKYHTIYGSWGTGKGKVVAWQGNLKWAGLPS